MLYNGIKIDGINLLIYMKTNSTDFEKVERTVFNWCQKNDINAAVECPYIDDEKGEALIYLDLFNVDSVDLNLLSVVYEKAKKKFKKISIALHLSEFIDHYNEVELTLEEFKELYNQQRG